MEYQPRTYQAISEELMNVIEISRKASSVMHLAPKDLDKLDPKTLRRFVKAATVVKKSAAILSDPAKYEGAQEARDKALTEFKALPATAEDIAIADAITRFSAARRKASAVSKLESDFAKI